MAATRTDTVTVADGSFDLPVWLPPSGSGPGLVLFQELVLTGATSDPACPLFEETVTLVARTFARAGLSPRLGLRLRRLLREAGLPEPQLVQHARAEGGPDSEVYRVVADLARGVLPLMEQHGVASADGLDIDTLADRLRAEALAHDAVLVPPPLVAGWTRVPA